MGVYTGIAQWFATDNGAVAWPASGNTHLEATTQATSAFADGSVKGGVGLCSLTVISDPGAAAAGVDVTIVNADNSATLFVWAVAKTTALHRQIMWDPPLDVGKGFAVNSGAADVRILASYVTF